MSTEYELRCKMHDGERWPDGGIYHYNLPNLPKIMANRKELVTLMDELGPDWTLDVLGAYSDTYLVDYCRRHLECELVIFDE